MEEADAATIEEEVNLPIQLRVSQPSIDYLPFWKDASARQRVRILLYSAGIYLPVGVKLFLILSIYPVYVAFFVWPMVADKEDRPELYYWHTEEEHRLAKTQALALLGVLSYIMLMYVISFYRASRTSPGGVPDAEDWRLMKNRHPADSPNSQFMLERKQTTGEIRTCSRCAKLKPDRSHHCRLCDTCVLKMDHHCPWIANCVGYFNYKYFFLMVTYGMLGLWVFVGSFWQTVFITQRNDDSSYRRLMFITAVYSVICVLNVAVTGFWVFHVYLITQAHTTIEFCEKRRRKAAEEEVGDSIFKRSNWENFKDALGENPLLWPFPCYSDALPKEEQLLIDAGSSSLLSRLPALDLEATIHKYSSSQEITETQLRTALAILAVNQPKHRDMLLEQLSGVPRGELLAFVILIGTGESRVKGALLFELGTEMMESDVMTREAAEVLADDMISAASEVTLKFCNDQSVHEYGEDLKRNGESFWTPCEPDANPGEKIIEGDLILTGDDTIEATPQYFSLSQTYLYRSSSSQSPYTSRCFVQWRTLSLSPASLTFSIRSGLGLSQSFTASHNEDYSHWVNHLRKVAICASEHSDYTKVKELGEGRYSKACLCRRRTDGKLVAIKRIEKKILASKPQALESLVSEIYIQREVAHTGIVSLLEVHELEDHIALVLEYCANGDMYKLVVLHKRFTLTTAARLTRQVLEAICYLHERRIMHRDVKLENILVTGDDMCKVSDFGLAIEVDEPLNMCCGSPGYVAPEILKKQPYGLSADIFSLGVVLFVLLSGRSPFAGKSNKEILKKNKKAKPLFREKDWENVPKSALDLTLRMLNPDPAKRITARKALGHAWIRQNPAGPLGLLEMPSLSPGSIVSPLQGDYVTFDMVHRNRDVFKHQRSQNNRRRRQSAPDITPIPEPVTAEKSIALQVFEELRSADVESLNRRFSLNPKIWPDDPRPAV